MNVYTVGLVTSLIIYLAVGGYAGRKVKHLEDFFVAGRQAPTLLIVGTLVASLMSTNAFMGETGTGYGGFALITVQLTTINIIGYVAGGLFFGRYLRRSRSLTVAEFFGERFASRRVQAAAGVTLIIGCTTYLFIICQGAAGVIGRVSDISFPVALLLTWASVCAFTLYSGSRGVVLTDTIMFLLFSVVAFLGLGYIVEAAGGWYATMEQLALFEGKPGIISWTGAIAPGADWETTLDVLSYVIILGLAWGVVVAVSPWQASRYLIARDEHTVLRSASITALVVLVLYTVLMAAGAAINLINPDIEPTQDNMIWAAMNIMPTLAGVMMMTGIMAAALSSASTFLSLSGFSASNDVLKSPGDDHQQLVRSRIAMLAVGLVALGLAWVVPRGNIYWITYFAGTLFASAWGPVAFMSVWSRRITESAAFWGIIAGFLGNLVARTLALLDIVDFPMYLHPILLGGLLSYLTIEVVLRFSQVSDEEHAHREKLHEVPDFEKDPDKLRRTVFWANLVMVSGALLAAVMVVFWVLPYRAATGGSAAGEWATALFCGFSVVIAGWLARWGAISTYR
jgi:sodium/pantothenate symporter